MLMNNLTCALPAGSIRRVLKEWTITSPSFFFLSSELKKEKLSCDVRHAGRWRKIQIEDRVCLPTVPRTNAGTVENNWKEIFLSARFVERNNSEKETYLSVDSLDPFPHLFYNPKNELKSS